MHRAARMKRELQMLQDSPPYGISCWSVENSIDHLEAQIIGGEGTPYEGGVFKLDIHLPERYPFEPPKVHFVTPIHHPNIDTVGRICLDTLKMPPKGAWKPALNISTVLTSVQLLMAEPNPEDPLMTDIANEFKYNKPLFIRNAKEWTAKYAKDLLAKDKENQSQSINQKDQISPNDNGTKRKILAADSVADYKKTKN
ncbi:ubiquitin-conjugating enzyme E2 T [Lingula anatina]|uniref:Ubiquitin-conjugating enzyme E2 T n=1 Tax=Lingula anatina TaxID=7574 RepID=A0A1S3IFL0_LINAN|nr:ubiquitin-conjugating enzyme E2 T [Lingula anatina]|eukprot:XP_013397017.1 ubiquitin-conjugating enzyme E2 T [Lingula anatina]